MLRTCRRADSAATVLTHSLPLVPPWPPAGPVAGRAAAETVSIPGRPRLFWQLHCGYRDRWLQACRPGGSRDIPGLGRSMTFFSSSDGRTEGSCPRPGASHGFSVCSPHPPMATGPCLRHGRTAGSRASRLVSIGRAEREPRGMSVPPCVRRRRQGWVRHGSCCVDSVGWSGVDGSSQDCDEARQTDRAKCDR